MKDTRTKVFSGLVWSYGERLTAQLVSFLVSVILARLLLPEEYGYVTIVLVFINIANVFVSEGFGNALIQKKDVDRLDFSTMQWFSLMVSFILYVLVFLLAPFVSRFYDMPLLVPVMRVMGIKLPLAAFNTVQKAYISRRMEFRKFFFATIIGTIISAIIGIALAYNGYGVWALVAQYLANSTIDTIILSFTSGLKTRFEFSLQRLKPLLAFGWRILAVGLMYSLYSNLRNLIIGKRYSKEDLAFSNRGEHFPALISGNINSTLSNVLFPALSSEQLNIEKVKSMTQRAIKVGTFMLAPILFGMAATANELIGIVLTEKWLPCVPYLQIMCVVYTLQPIQTAGIQAMKALGNSKLYMDLEIIKKIGGLIILGLAVFGFDSILIIVFSALVAEIFSTIINLPHISKLISYSVGDQLTDVGKPFLASIIMLAVVSGIRLLLQSMGINIIIMLIIEVVVGIITYFAVCKVIRIDSFDYIKDILIRLKNKRHA